MAFLHSSRAKGRIPLALKAAAEVRFTGHEADGGTGTLLHFEVPTLGSAAGEIFSQQLLWEDGPTADQTAFELLGAALSDVAARRKESNRYDPGMLLRIGTYRRTLQHGLSGISLPDTDLPQVSAIDQSLIAAAAELVAVTPGSRRVRVAGRLDVMGASQSVLKVEVRPGTVVNALWEGREDVESLREYFNRDVVLEGQGVFRPSGGLLRIDADAIRTAGAQDDFFRELPSVTAVQPDHEAMIRVRPGEKSPYARLLGSIPAEESDEDFAAAVEALS